MSAQLTFCPCGTLSILCSAGCYTRDLYWCCQAAKQHLPLLQQQLTWTPVTATQQQQQFQQLQDQLDKALQLYVSLQSNLLDLQQQQQQPQQPQQQQQQRNTHFSTTAPAASEQQLQQLVQDSWQLVDSLLPRLEATFLKAMLVEEPGWLTKHQGYPIPAHPDLVYPADRSRGSSLDAGSSSSSMDSSSSSNPAAPGGRGSQMASGNVDNNQQSPWLFAGKALAALQGLLNPAAATATLAASGASSSSQASGSITQLLGAEPPRVQVQVAGRVQAFDWHDQQERAAAVAAVQQILQPPQDTGTTAAPHQQLVGGHSGFRHSSSTSHCSGDSIGTEHSSSMYQHVPAAAAYEVLECWPQPVLLRGAAATWPCCAAGAQEGGWDLQWLAGQQGLQGKVRVAPSLQFPFVEPQLLEILLKLRGKH
jgi:hypothetical protein